MASRFQIINNALVVTDTNDSSILLDVAARDTYYDTKELDDGNVVLYDTSGVNTRSSVVFRDALTNTQDSAGTTFTATTFRTFVRQNLGFSSASGGSGARTLNVLNGSPFANFAALETYSQSNLSELINSSTEVAVATVTGVAVYEWAGEDTPSSYVNNWVVRENLMDSFANLTQDRVPIMGATSLVDSGIRMLPDGNVFIPTTVNFEGSSVQLGDISRLSESNSFISIENSQFPDVRFDVIDARRRSTAASNRPRHFYLIEAENPFTFQSDDSQQITTNPLIYNISSTIDSQTNTVTFKTFAEMTNVRIQIKYSSGNESVVRYIPSREAWLDGTGGLTFDSGDNLLVFESDSNRTLPTNTNVINLNSSAFKSFNGDTVTIETRADSISLLGNSSSVPYLVTGVQRGEFRDLAYQSDTQIDATGFDGNLTTDTDTIQELAQAVDDLNISGGGIDGVTIQDEGGSLATNATTLNFTGDAVEATGSTATKTITINQKTDEAIRDLVGTTLVAGTNVTIDVDDANNTITINASGGGTTPPSPVSTDLRYGLSSESDPASVVFSNLFDEPNPTNPITVSTGVTTAGQYFHIFSSNTHNINTIRDTVLDQTVYQDGGTGNIFTKHNDVRTENSITYDAYVIGPLNAGVDEDYVITFI